MIIRYENAFFRSFFQPVYFFPYENINIWNYTQMLPDITSAAYQIPVHLLPSKIL